MKSFLFVACLPYVAMGIAAHGQTATEVYGIGCFAIASICFVGGAIVGTVQQSKLFQNDYPKMLTSS
jgi:hypothetical protein